MLIAFTFYLSEYNVKDKIYGIYTLQWIHYSEYYMY